MEYGKMKLKYFISTNILLIFTCLFTSCFAQGYTPFFINHSKWVMEKIYPVIGPGDDYLYWENYTLHDTVLDNKTYTILARRDLCFLWADQSGDLHKDPTLDTSERLIGGLREENKKVYEFDFYNHSEQLLYDYNIVVGDTLYFTPTVFTIIRALNPPENGLVNYIVTNSTAYSYPFETGKLTEGFGSSYGLFGTYYSSFNDLLCFARDEQADSLGYSCTPCSQYFTVGTQEPEISDSGNVKIYPNPTQGILTLETNNENKILEITVLDIAGQLLKKDNYNTNHVELNLSDFPASIFLLRIRFDNNFEVMKRVVKF